MFLTNATFITWQSDPSWVVHVLVSFSSVREKIQCGHKSFKTNYFSLFTISPVDHWALDLINYPALDQISNIWFLEKGKNHLSDAGIYFTVLWKYQSSMKKCIAELLNVRYMTDISAKKYLQVGVKSLGDNAIFPNKSFFGKICTTYIRFLCIN